MRTRGIFGSGALQNERSSYRGKARHCVLEPESRPFLHMASCGVAEDGVVGGNVVGVVRRALARRRRHSVRGSHGGTVFGRSVSEGGCGD